MISVLKRKKDAKEKHKDMHSKDKERKASLTKAETNGRRPSLESSEDFSEKRRKKGKRRAGILQISSQMKVKMKKMTTQQADSKSGKQ